LSVMTSGDVQRLTVDGSTGYVGIANTAPAYPLDVKGTANISGVLSTSGYSFPGAKPTSNGQVITGKTDGTTSWGTSQTYTAGTGISISGSTISTVGVTTGSVPFIGSDKSLTESNSQFFWDNTNNRLGIANNAPAYPLDVSGNIRATGAIYANTNGGLYFQGGDDAALYDINVGNTMGVYGVQNSAIGSIKLGSGGGIISGANGNVGIGTTSPQRNLDITNGVGNDVSAAIIAGGEGKNAILYLGTPNLGVVTTAMKTAIIAEGQTNYSRAKLHFALNNVSDNGISTSIADARMTIQSDGNVGIGTTSPSAPLEVNSFMKFTNADSDVNDGRIGNSMFGPGLNLVGILGTAPTAYRKIQLWGEITQNQNDGTNTFAGNSLFAGNVTVNGNINAPSDIRLKTHIETLTNVLAKIENLRGVRYEFIDQKKYATGPQIGVIAQELQKEFPELVITKPDGYLAVNYTQLTGVLIQAVKEQQQEIKSMRETLDDHTKQIEAMMKMIQELKEKSKE